MSLSGLLDSIFLRPLESPKRAREMGFWSAGCLFRSTELTLRHLEEKYVMQTLNEEYVRITYTRNFKFRQGSFFCHRMMSTKYLHETGARSWFPRCFHRENLVYWHWNILKRKNTLKKAKKRCNINSPLIISLATFEQDYRWKERGPVKFASDHATRSLRIRERNDSKVIIVQGWALAFLFPTLSCRSILLLPLREIARSKYLVPSVHEKVMRKWILGDGRCLCSKLASWICPDALN